MGESPSMAALDSGCTKTVCSLSWLSCYLETVSPSDFSLVKEFESNTLFKFGSGKLIKSIKRVTISIRIAGKNTDLTKDVIETDIPLLLSKEAMKKSNTRTDFANDIMHIFDVEIPARFSSSGHYCIPIGKLDYQIIKKITSMKT